ncbi:VOC family protein [Pseudonocardia adelaidensis]|uniref:VOC family protein n=1 Tax=Pseudonocardia adelaidensis TaxID=648754 RepID=A0ABP9P005_9PSEU
MSIYVTLRYDDARAAIAYLTGTLGLVEQQVHQADDGSVGHAELSFGDGVVMLGTRRSRPDGTPDRFDTGRAVVYLALDSAAAVDAHHDRAVAAGAEVVQELVDQPYGSREYAVRDPEGNVWSVGSYRPEVKP